MTFDACTLQSPAAAGEPLLDDLDDCAFLIHMVPSHLQWPWPPHVPCVTCVLQDACVPDDVSSKHLLLGLVPSNLQYCK